MQFKKRILSWLLVMLILIKSISMLSVVISYEINKQYYAEVLCENKNKPELACKGKCVFMKKMEVAMETQHKNNTNDFITIIQKALEYPVYSNDHNQDHVSILNLFTAASTPAINIDPADLCYTGDIFHPPVI